MRELEYPFDSEWILKKAKSIKKTLLSDGTTRIKKKIAVLGGSTTHDVIRILELFLLHYGIEPSFYESEYGQYWQDAMFDNPELAEFAPDLIYIHTTNRNIAEYPAVGDSREKTGQLIKDTYEHFRVMWEKLKETYGCVIIQNNFEFPYYRLLGNMDAVNSNGRVAFVNRLNALFAEYAAANENFYLQDIQYLSACYGLDKWGDSFYWHMYKYALCVPAIPTLSYNLANIIKSVYGKNKKAYVLDLDNTLWGGVVGDDGPENIEIGQETSMGQVYAEFQSYLKEQKQIGIMLNVSSKNEEENALAGLSRPDSVLKPDDFMIIKANWEPKSKNVAEIAAELNIGTDSLVFVDDNPAEREIIRQNLPGVAVPEMDKPEEYLKTLDRSGFFEVTGLSEDDTKRNEMYKANQERKKMQDNFADYGEYLKSLDMKAEIGAFVPLYMARIAQLTNKSNQFNLTTKRLSQADIEHMAEDTSYITLYGKLADKFGDNGVVSVVIGKIKEDALHIDLWLMSCRVLKRDMEFAMMDRLTEECKKRGIARIYGYYYPTAKNKMVENFYGLQGFTLKNRDDEGNAEWEYEIPAAYENKNRYIEITE
mgnify:FL=1